MKKSLVGVRFRESGKIYYFDPGEISLSKGDAVIVSTSNGEDYGKVMLDPREIPEEDIKDEIYPVIRKATQEDNERKEYLQTLSEDAGKVFMERVSERNLGMKLIDVQYTFDEKKVVFYFTAEGRVDFRELVKDLAGHFHARIELRQIGVRDEARKYASIGVCGRKCCCASWLNDFVPVSIKMAKEQNLSLNSTKISGICGRLLCCLTYEEEYYEELSKRMPKIGATIKTPDGEGIVYKLRTLEETVLVKIVNEQNETEIRRYTLEELDEAARQPTIKTPPKVDPPTPALSRISTSSGRGYKEVVEEQKQKASAAPKMYAVNARKKGPARKQNRRNKAVQAKKDKNSPEPRKGSSSKKTSAASPKKTRRSKKRRTPDRQATFNKQTVDKRSKKGASNRKSRTSGKTFGLGKKFKRANKSK